MVLALLKKELRETWAFAALALVLFLAYLTKLTGAGGRHLGSLLGVLPGMSQGIPEVPFVGDGFPALVCLIGGILAIALGLRQSAWEPHQGTALFLLHLPMSRWSTFVTKLAAGLGLVLLCTLVPILLYAAWAATPGNHPGPFDWFMTSSAFRTWAILPLIYLGAFASGIRPGKWYGSRLFPLFVVVVPATLAFAFGPWWLIGLPIIVLMAAMLVSDILWVAGTRDY